MPIFSMRACADHRCDRLTGYLWPCMPSYHALLCPSAAARIQEPMGITPPYHRASRHSTAHHTTSHHVSSTFLVQPQLWLRDFIAAQSNTPLPLPGPAQAHASVQATRPCRRPASRAGNKHGSSTHKLTTSRCPCHWTTFVSPGPTHLSPPPPRSSYCRCFFCCAHMQAARARPMAQKAPQLPSSAATAKPACSATGRCVLRCRPRDIRLASPPSCLAC